MMMMMVNLFTNVRAEGKNSEIWVEKTGIFYDLLVYILTKVRTASSF